MHRILSTLLVSVCLISTLHADDGLVKLHSKYSVKETLDRFEKAVAEKGMTVFTRIDHAKGAAGVDLQLRPTELLIFGNPRVGTLLMQSNRTAAIDLPLKVLAWQDDNGDVWLVYNEPGYLASRHGITDREPVIEKMRKALMAFSRTATD